MEKSEKLSVPEQERAKVSELFWSQEELAVVTQFLNKTDGKPVADPDQRRKLWQSTAATTDIKPNSYQELSEETKKLLSHFPGGQDKLTETPKDTETEEQYLYKVKTRAKVIQDVALASLRKFGIWGPEESRRAITRGGLRSQGKSNYYQDEYFGGWLEDKGFVSEQEGGPQVVSTIAAPRIEDSKDTSDFRERRSLGHEITHALRAESNKSFWQGFEEEAGAVGLRQPSKERKFLGGFLVGSNFQGSEAAGDLFGFVASNTVEGKEVTVEEALNHSVLSLAERTTKFEKDLETYRQEQGVLANDPNNTQPKEIKRVRYLAANLALVHHLKQLVDSGLGDLPARKLLPLVTYGYGSFEKVPYLIRLEVFTKEKAEKMQKVVDNILDWLTQKEEGGFKRMQRRKRQKKQLIS